MTRDLPSPTSVLHRVADIARDSVDKDTRTVRIAVSSEVPVERWFGEEILDHGDNSVVMDRLANRAPLLLGHDPDSQIGVVEKAWIEGRRLRAEVRFGKSPSAEAVYQDILDGIRSKISVGYRIRKSVLEKSEKDKRTYRVMSWEPMEVSVVSVPADDSVGVGRQVNLNETPMPDPVIPAAAPTPAAPTPTETRAQVTVVNDDSERIARYAQANPSRRDEAMAALAKGTRFNDFIGGLQEVRSNVPNQPVVDPNLGLSAREIRNFSITRAIAGIVNGTGLVGFEKEACDAYAKQHGLTRNERSFFIPSDITTRWQSRDLGAVAAANGGVTVATEVLGGDLIELLRARLLSARLGVKTMFGLTGNISIPKVTGGAAGAWLAEAAPITPSSQTFSQVALSPKRYGAATAYSRQLVVQSSIDVESFVRNDLAATVALALDKAVFEGLGTGGEPRGIIATSGVNTVTFGGAATWAKVVDFETQVALDNADVGTMAYVTTPGVRGKWKQVPKVTGAGNFAGFLWQDGGYIPVMAAVGALGTQNSPPEGIVNGYRALASTIISGDKVLFGNFADAILAAWLPLEVIVDPYSLSLNHQVRVVVNTLADVGVRHPESFAVSTDTGAA